MNKLILFLFSNLLLQIGWIYSVAAVPVCTVNYYSCCAGTCNSCGVSAQVDPAYNDKTINTLPIDFNYNHSDTNTGNDTCSSTDCGTKNCAAPATSYSTHQLPAPAGACTFNPDNKQLPVRVTCRWNDGVCNTYCNRYTTCSYTTCTGT